MSQTKAAMVFTSIDESLKAALDLDPMTKARYLQAIFSGEIQNCRPFEEELHYPGVLISAARCWDVLCETRQEAYAKRQKASHGGLPITTFHQRESRADIRGLEESAKKAMQRGNALQRFWDTSSLVPLITRAVTADDSGRLFRELYTGLPDVTRRSPNLSNLQAPQTSHACSSKDNSNIAASHQRSSAHPSAHRVARLPASEADLMTLGPPAEWNLFQQSPPPSETYGAKERETDAWLRKEMDKLYPPKWTAMSSPHATSAPHHLPQAGMESSSSHASRGIPEPYSPDTVSTNLHVQYDCDDAGYSVDKDRLSDWDPNSL